MFECSSLSFFSLYPYLYLCVCVLVLEYSVTIMAQNNQGIQHLLQAEKKAMEKVSEARKRKLCLLISTYFLSIHRYVLCRNGCSSYLYRFLTEILIYFMYMSTFLCFYRLYLTCVLICFMIWFTFSFLSCNTSNGGLSILTADWWVWNALFGLLPMVS